MRLVRAGGQRGGCGFKSSHNAVLVSQFRYMSLPVKGSGGEAGRRRGRPLRAEDTHARQGWRRRGWGRSGAPRRAGPRRVEFPPPPGALGRPHHPRRGARWSRSRRPLGPLALPAEPPRDGCGAAGGASCLPRGSGLTQRTISYSVPERNLANN